MRLAFHHFTQVLTTIHFKLNLVHSGDLPWWLIKLTHTFHLLHWLWTFFEDHLGQHKKEIVGVLIQNWNQVGATLWSKSFLDQKTNLPFSFLAPITKNFNLIRYCPINGYISTQSFSLIILRKFSPSEDH